MALALSLAAQAVQSDDIVVLARKLRLIEVDLKAPKRGGRVVIERCRVIRSSGDAELDAVGCDAARECAQAGIPTRRALQACTEQRAQPRLNVIVAARRAARAVVHP